MPVPRSSSGPLLPPTTTFSSAKKSDQAIRSGPDGHNSPYNISSNVMTDSPVPVHLGGGQRSPHSPDQQYTFGSHPGDEHDYSDEDAISLLSSLSDHDERTLLPATHHANRSAASVFSFESIPMMPLTQTQARGPELQKKVTFFNGLGLVVGAMIGSGLFSSPGPVLEATGAPGTALLIWLVSGLLALLGALCYVELGTMLPMNGGESVYLSRAFGSLVSFAFEFVSIVVQKASHRYPSSLFCHPTHCILYYV